MKKILKPLVWGVLAATAIAVPSCESFEETNTKKDAISKNDIKPMYLATTSILRSTLGADLWQRIINLGTDTYSQYFCNDKYSPNICVPNDSYIDTFWNNSWTWINNLSQAITLCNNTPEEQNIAQMCRIWRVWVYMRLTDLLGDIPYSQACNGDYSFPKYDSQKDIYYDMVKELAEASAALDMTATRNCEKDDPIFSADWNKWRQLANTLRLRLAMRMTEADPAKAKAEAEAAAAAPGGFITENVVVWRANNAYTTHIGYNFFYPLPHYWEGRLTLSTSMQKILTNLGGIAVEMKDYYQPEHVPSYADPRALINFNVTSEGTLAAVDRRRRLENGKYVWDTIADYRGRWEGVQPGLTEAHAALPENLNTNHSRLGVFFISDDPTPPVKERPTIQKDKNMVLLYANEPQFLLAEAALRGYSVGGDAKSYYEAGIRTSMAYYGNLIDSDDIEKYLISDMKNDLGTSVAFDSSEGDNLSGNRNSKLMKIITQKYIAGFPENSFEAWNDYRRLGMPVLDAFVEAQQGNVIEVGAPDYLGSLRRFIYPAIEQTLNPDSYAEASQRMGGDKTTSRMWWDARTEVVR